MIKDFIIFESMMNLGFIFSMALTFVFDKKWKIKEFWKAYVVFQSLLLYMFFMYYLTMLLIKHL